MKRLDQLTFTRFFAILLVLFYHGGVGVYFNWINKFPLSAILHSAPTAVSYLYVLSGFVMSLVYYRPKEKFNVRGYWTARFVRIYPLYIISFLFVCYYYLDYMAKIKIPKILVNVFVLQAWWPPYAQSFNYASWSMTVEFFFYAAFPFFVMWAYRQSMQKLIAVSMVFWGASQLIHYVLWVGYFPAWELFVVYNPIFHLNSFILGVVGGIWYLRIGREQPLNQWVNFLLLVGSLLLVAGYTILSNIYLQLPHDLEPMAGLLSPLFTLFIIALALDKTVVSTVLEHKWLVALGETAFALYILEVPFEWIFKRALESSNLTNPHLVFAYVNLPLILLIGLGANIYLDPLLRKLLRNVLKRVSMPLLILDLGIFAAAVYLSFSLRFTDGRELYAYQNTIKLMFWAAFIFRTIASVVVDTLNPKRLYLPLRQIIRPLLVSVTAGSVAVAAVVYAGNAAGWVENFPRSIFFIDWGVVLGLSFLARVMFRLAGFYRPTASAVAPAG